MTPRGILTTIGATALGVGLVVGGATAIPNAFAQESPATTEAPAEARQAADPEARIAEAYERFVSALASELDADEAAVDAAIRGALKEQVAAQETAGNLDADQVAEIQAMIDESEAPLGLGIGGPGSRDGMHGFSGREGGFKGRDGEHRGPHGGFDERGSRDGFEGAGGDDESREAPKSDTAPATLPSADDASDQAVPANGAPSVRDVVI